MARDVDTFGILFPEFCELPVQTVTLFISRAVAKLKASSWGLNYDDAVLYHAAHEIALRGNRAAGAQASESGHVVTPAGAGAITAASTDGVSVSYAAPASASGDSDAAAWYNQTSYGQHFLALREQSFTSIRKVGSPAPRGF